MTPAQRKALLEHVNAGMDVDSAAAKLNIRMAEISKSSKRFRKQLDEAFHAGTARLRGRLLTCALSEGDTKTIATLLEQREATAAAGRGIQKIQRIVVVPKCARCGHKPDMLGTGGETRPLHSTRPADKPGNGAAQ